MSAIEVQTPSSEKGPAGAGVYRKVARRLIPFLCLLYVFNILDRANVGFAKNNTTMQQDIGIAADPWIYELGIGVFYFGYLAFEVPANLLMRRFGARRWMARIMISWGLVSCATMAVIGPVSFYAARILLGVAEAGFFPGIILYLTYWFPARERARVTAYFMLAIALAGMFGNPLSGMIVRLCKDSGGLAGWQWLFLLEGLPSVLLGVAVLFYLPDGPRDARWLSPAERDWLEAQLAEEDRLRPPHGEGLRGAALDGRVWLLIALYFTLAVGANAAGAHFPTIIKESCCDDRQQSDEFVIGVLSGLPSLCAVFAMTALAWSSDRTGERRGHVAFAAFVAAGGWLIAAVAPSGWLVLLGLCVAMAGMMAMLATYWAIPPALLGGTAAAGGIALINSLANVGGALAPNILGVSLRRGGRMLSGLGLEGVVAADARSRFGMVVLAATMLLGCALALCLPRGARR
jgi:sugar phosphate permease